ncbi:MAG: stage IV sporulation protein A [Oscillospiraceae bacterium]|nr:stage IV sporulation protein A [Oscillospiraceae bacterium]MBQ8928744.1 stage IV sporulation protein A [Oscillospiraceae bacterium]
MMDIYSDIARRTDGCIYIGVVGPVRTGKSTLIQRFMETLVIPNIEEAFRKERAVDELPQSAAGKTIMTTEPKFIPEQAVPVELEGGARLRARMIDCVGYIVPSALGYIENEMPRMVQTPWYEEEVPFNMAAEVGTQKVITEHATIGLVVTTDGSISDIPREEYAECEQRVIEELQGLGKPFVVLLNCVEPDTPDARELAASLSERYGTQVLPVSCLTMGEAEIREILTALLYAFPVREVNFAMPGWISVLSKEHPVKQEVFGAVREAAQGLSTVADARDLAEKLLPCRYIEHARATQIDLGTGTVTITAALEPSLFFHILSEATGLSIRDEGALMHVLQELCAVRQQYARLEPALREVEETGYGIVMPTMEELRLEEPEIIRQGGKYGVRLKASAPSIHMMRAGIRTTVSPIVGSEKQSEELVMYLLQGFEEDPAKLWESNIFGKSLHELVNEGLRTKLYRMPAEARGKLQETLERVINEGCSGLICFIL